MRNLFATTKVWVLSSVLLASTALPLQVNAQRDRDHDRFYGGVRQGSRGYDDRYDRGRYREPQPPPRQSGGIGPGKGAAIGAAGGAALGAIFGGGLKGAIIGGAAGAGVGAVAGQANQNNRDNRQRDYRDYRR